MNLLVKLLISTAAVAVTAWLLPGIHIEDNFWTAVWVAIALSALNAFVRPILVVLTIPATILTLGLFMLVVNGIIVYLADWFITGFYVDGFLWAILFSIIVAIVNSFFESLVLDKGNKRKG